MKRIVLLLFVMAGLGAMPLARAQILKEILKEKADEAIEQVIEQTSHLPQATGQHVQPARQKSNPRPFVELSPGQQELAQYREYGWNPYKYADISDQSKDYLFVDEFDNNRSGWFVRDNFRQTAVIRKGHFIIRSNGNVPVSKALALNINARSDFEIEARMRYMGKHTQVANYLAWGKSPYGSFLFGFSGDADAFTIDRYTRNYQSVVPWTHAPNLKRNTYNTLTVRKVGDTYFFFINKELMATAPFEPFYGRYIGFFVPEHNEIQVDYLTVANLKKSDIHEKIRHKVTQRVEDWQEKGKFEKTQAYLERVNQANREKMVRFYTQQVVDDMALEKMNYGNVSNAYDSDGEVFKLNYENFEPIYLQVPIDEAPAFDENLQSLQYDSASFTITQDNQFAIMYLEVTNPANGKTYVYDSGQQVAFNSTDLELNFDPVAIDVEETESSGGAGETAKKVVVGKPKVDTDIPQTGRSRKNVYALVIGNEDYSSYQTGLNSEVNVDFAENDARIVKAYLVKTMGVPERNINLLINGTLGQMNQAIEKMKTIAEVSDGNAELIFYYSGHGLPDEVSREPYLIPVDISGTNIPSAIKLKDVYNALTAYESKRVTVFLDACFSGGARNEPLVAMKGVKIKPKDTYLTGNFVVFSSSSGAQSSAVYREKQHGLFTYFLLKKWHETRGNLSYKELAGYITKKVALESVVVLDKKQSPQVKYSPVVAEEWENWEF